MEDNSMRKANDVDAEFVAECTNTLGFLVKDWKFSDPEVDVYGSVVSVTFYKNEIAIECILDKREEDVSVKIVKLENGKKPDAYRKDDKGNIVREYLTQLLIRKGIRDISFPDPGDLKQFQKRRANFRRELFGYARMLQSHGLDILEGSAKVFEVFEQE
jgi:hypothetical protein